MTLTAKLEAAYAACEWLAKEGHSVARVEISTYAPKPRIRLNNRPSNIRSVEITEMLDGQTRRFREATIAGCRVEWEV